MTVDEATKAWRKAKARELWARRALRRIKNAEIEAFLAMRKAIESQPKQ